MMKSRRMILAEYVARMGDRRNEYRIYVGKLEEMRPIERQGSKWVDNFKMCLRDIGWGGMDWIDLTEVRDQWRAFLNMVMNLWIP
jgi:hypothetical protein